MLRLVGRSAAAGSNVTLAVRLRGLTVQSGPTAATSNAALAFQLVLLLLLLSAPASAGPAPFLLPDGAVKLFADDFDSPKYALNTNLWTRLTGKPDWQLQVNAGVRGLAGRAWEPRA